MFKKLAKTSNAGHYHVFFMDEEGGRASISSFDKKHAHEVTYVPETPPGMDPLTGLPTPGIPARWEVAPAADGHTHDIEDLEIDPDVQWKDPDETEEDRVRDVYALFKEACETESESITAGQEAEDFYYGKQWRDSDKNYLHGLQRAALTINKIAPEIDRLSGYQRGQRTDWQFLPTEEGDAAVADILNIVVKQIAETNTFEREESDAFFSTIVPGRSFLNCYVDHTETIEGDIRLVSHPWDLIALGPHRKHDLSDCEHAHLHDMFSMSQLKKKWKDKAEQIQTDFDLMSSRGGNTKPHRDMGVFQYSDSESKAPASIVTSTGLKIVDIHKKQFREIHCWQRVYKDVSAIVSNDWSFSDVAWGWDKEDVLKIKTIPGFYVFPRTVSKIRITKVCGNVLLDDEYPADLPIDDFCFVPIYCKKHKNRFWGKVEPAKDPQREVNYRRSQAVDLGNKCIASGWKYTENTFPDSREEKKFLNNSSSPGFAVKVTELDQLDRIEAPPFPNSLVNLIELADSTLSNLIAISVEPGGANDSGAKLMKLEQMQLSGNEFLFDNLSFAKKKLGKIIIHFIQKYFTPQRILRIIQNVAAKQEVSIDGQPLSSIDPEAIIELLTTKDLTKYDLLLSESNFSPSQQLATFAFLSDMAGKGAPISPTLLIKTSPLPEKIKQEALADFGQQQQGQAQAAEGDQKTEINKTLIGQGIIPPEVQADLMGQQAALQNGQTPQPGM